ncbi:MAG: cation:dicarboxylase symporter family transporter, partial [Eggerthellaceae bacterium]
MKAIVKAWTSLSLIKRILIGLVIGALIGIFGPKDLVVISMLGILFVNALKAIAPLLVFFLVVNALCRTKMPKSMRTIVILYVVATLCAAFTAVIASYIMPTELTLSGVESASQSAPSDIGEVVTTLLTNMVANPVDALVNANYLGILVWAIILGIALRFTSEGTRDFFSSMSHAVSIVVRWVIACAPFGIFGLIYTSVSQNGVDI